MASVNPKNCTFNDMVLDDAVQPMTTPFDEGDSIQPMEVTGASWTDCGHGQFLSLSDMSLTKSLMNDIRTSSTLSLPCLPGERVIRSAHTHQGLIVLTDYRLAILKHPSHYQHNHHNSSATETNNGQNPTVITSSAWSAHFVALLSIWKVDIIDLVHLRVVIKTGRLLRLTFHDSTQCLLWSEYLQPETINHKSGSESFAFRFRIALSQREDRLDPKFKRLLFETPQPINVETEFHRLGFPTHLWELKNVNEDYAICKTYPISHIVPKSITAANVRDMAPFRQNNRFPSVVWRSTHSGAVLMRCSQPCVGFIGFRNKQDEQFLSAVLDCCQEDFKHLQRQQNPDSPSMVSVCRRLLIVDARNYSAAFVNCLMGGGYEKVQNYANVDIEWKNLPNIHAVRASFEKMLVCVHSTAEQWLSAWEATEWPGFLAQVLRAAWDVAHTLHSRGCPVIVHCTDGWDRTPQLTALAQLLLDPYYRTLEGFRHLVDREWLQFGHKFAHRCAHQGEANDVSPIFMQFLDCVHQLLNQYPHEFEFNNTFLVKLGTHVYSGLFGTFLGNSLQERSAHHTNTCSVWSFLHPKINASVRNYIYKPTNKVLIPSWSTRDLVLWRGMYGDEVNILLQEPHRAVANSLGCLLANPNTDSFLAYSQPQVQSAINHEKISSRPESPLVRRVLEETRLTHARSPLLGRENSIQTPKEWRRNTKDSPFSSTLSRSLSLPNVNLIIETISTLPECHADMDEDCEEMREEYCRFSGFPKEISQVSNAITADKNGNKPPVGSGDVAADEEGLDVLQHLMENGENKIQAGPTLSDEQVKTREVSTSSARLSSHTISSSTSSTNDAPSTSSGQPSFTEAGSTNGISNEFFVKQHFTSPVTSCQCVNRLSQEGSNMSEGSQMPPTVILEVQQDWDGLNHVGARVDPYNSYIHMQRTRHAQQKNSLQERAKYWQKEATARAQECNRMKQQVQLLTQRLQTSNGLNTDGAVSTVVDGQCGNLADVQLNGVHPQLESSGSSEGSTLRSTNPSYEIVKRKEPVMWMPDYAVNACTQCDAQFTHFLRKHHCRLCGKIFCHTCSNFYTAIPDLNLFTPVRVCEQCFLKSQEATSSSGGDTEATLVPITNTTVSISQKKSISQRQIFSPLFMMFRKTPTGM